MSPRKNILRALQRAHAAKGGGFIRPPEISGFSGEPEKYQKAVNQLLSERLIEGQKDGEGRMAIALNGHKMEAVRRELRPVWANPVLWAAVGVAAVAAWFVLGVGGA
ncbi:MAG: hypothetical protein RJQ04_16850 [Longimicrobiales bacterium]